MELLILKLGKSPGIVILDKSAHLTKIKAILYDSSKFTKTPNDNQAVEIDKTLYDELLLSNQQGIIDTCNIWKVKTSRDDNSQTIKFSRSANK